MCVVCINYNGNKKNNIINNKNKMITVIIFIIILTINHKLSLLEK